MQLLAVNHHYYRDVAPQSGIYPITELQFKERVEQLGKTNRLITESELLKALNGDLNGVENICLLTFDDGLAEQISAAEWLFARGLSAMFFVPTAPLVQRKLLPVHKLQLLRTLMSDLSLSHELEKHFGSQVFSFDRDAAVRQYRYDSLIATQVKYAINFVLDQSQRDTFVNEIFSDHCGDERYAADKFYMSTNAVRWLAQRGMLGTHGHSHVPLGQLSPREIEFDIELSLDILKEIGGCAVTGIAYPYGGDTAVGARVFEIAGRLGLQYGFTTMRGTNEISTTLNPLALKRFDTSDMRPRSDNGPALQFW